MNSCNCDISPKAVLIGALLGLGAAGSIAQTMTVTTLHDVSDFGGLQQVANLPGPDGRVSLKEACTAANNTPGPQTIEFAIPTSEFWLITNLALIELEVGPFLLSDDGTTIDFTTQTANIGDTNPTGPDVGIYGLQPNGWGSPAIIIDANDCVIRGLGGVWQRGSSVAIWQGSGNRVVGCQTGTIEIDGSFGGPVTHSNVIGGTTPQDANDLFTVEILCWSDNNVVIGNRIRHVRVEGSTYCVFPTGNRIGGPTEAERNVIAGYGSYGEEGFPSGAQVAVTWARDTIIEGNYIGTTPDGMASANQIGPTGVGVYDSINTVVRGNLIAGLRTVGTNHYAGQIFGEGIHVGAINRDCETTTIEDNTIGLAADGVTPILTARGILISPFTSLRTVRDTRVGGVLDGQANEIAAVEFQGILVSSLIGGVTIRGNSFHDNGALGIDLIPNSGGAGLTPNDIGDADVGGNGLQNFPILTGAERQGASTQVVGTFNSIANQTFTLDFYESPQCDVLGVGEGAMWLGSMELSTSASGNAGISATIAAPATVGEVITATATDSGGSTSEFSNCVLVAEGQAPSGDVDGDGDVDIADLALLLSAFGTCAGDPAFNAAADFDQNGCVELADLATLLGNFGG
jgi:hypothetical protein